MVRLGRLRSSVGFPVLGFSLQRWTVVGTKLVNFAVNKYSKRSNNTRMRTISRFTFHLVNINTHAFKKNMFQIVLRQT